MDFFWGNVFEYFKDRRGPAFFVVALFAFLVVAAVAAAIFQNLPAEQMQDFLTYATPAVGIILVALIWSGIRRAQARSRNRYKSSPLSRDEIIKARSKLSNTSNFKKL